MIQEHRISDIDDLAYNLNVLPNHFIFRGQADASWGLQSSLERMLGSEWSEKRARIFEDYSLESFESKFHIYCGAEHKPDSKFSWLSVMQHYGVPTRLIDFTTSPYVALYFSLETYNPAARRDFSIFAIDYSSTMERSIEYIKSNDRAFSETQQSISRKQDDLFSNVLDRYSYDIAWISEPSKLNERIDRQLGTFLISGSLKKPISDIMNLPMYNETKMIKFVIPHHLYEGAYVALRKMGINSKSLYGDLGGLAKSIRMELSAYVMPS